MKLNNTEIQLIKQTIESKGWEIVEKMLLDKFVDNARPKHLEGINKKSNEQIVTEVKAVDMACRSVQGFITRLKTVTKTKTKREEGYK